MVNNIRQQQSRGLPTRGVNIRGVQTQRLAQTTAVQRSKEDQFKRNLQITTNNVIGSVSNLNQLQEKAQSFYNNSLSNIPLKYHSTFKSYINQASANLRSTQASLISQYENKVKVYGDREAYFSNLGKVAVSDKYYVMEKQAKSVLSSLKAGTIIDAETTSANIVSLGASAQKEKAYRIQQTKSNTEAQKKLQQRVDSYVKAQGQSSSQVPSVVQIRDKLGVSLSDAKLIRTNIQEGRKGDLEALSISKGLSTQERKEKFSKEMKQTLLFIELFEDNFYTKQVNTLASFPKEIQKVRSVFFQEYSPTEQRQFNKLNTSQKNLVLKYSVLKTIQKLLPKSTLSVDKGTEKILKARGVDLSSADAKLLFKITFGTESELLDLVRKVDVSKFINLYNKQKSLQVAVPKSRSESLVNNIRAELKSLSKATKLPKFFDNFLMNKIFGSLEQGANVKLKQFTLNSLDEILRNELKEGRGMSSQEYNYWKGALKDLTGFKTFAKNSINGTKRDFKKFIDTLALDISGRRKKNIASYPEEIQKVRSIFYGELTQAEQKKFDKRAIELAVDSLLVVPKVFGRGFVIAGKDLWNLGGLIIGFGKSGASMIGRDIVKLSDRARLSLSGSRRTLLEKQRDTLEITKLIRKAQSVEKFLRENPAIVSLAIASGVVALTKSNRDLLIKNPKEWFAQVISFFADNVIIKGVSKVPKALKITSDVLSSTVSKLIRSGKRLPKINGLDISKLIAKGKIIPIKEAKNMFSEFPTNKFTLQIRDLRGNIRYTNSKGVKRLRQIYKLNVPKKKLNSDIIDTINRIKIKSERVFRSKLRAEQNKLLKETKESLLKIARDKKREGFKNILVTKKVKISGTDTLDVLQFRKVRVSKQGKVIKPTGRFTFIDAITGRNIIDLPFEQWKKLTTKQLKFLNTVEGKKLLAKKLKGDTRVSRLARQRDLERNLRRIKKEVTLNARKTKRVGRFAENLVDDLKKIKKTISIDVTDKIKVKPQSTPKAVGITPKTFIGYNKQGKRISAYLFVDQSGRQRIFSSRKEYIKAIKRSFSQINDGSKSLVDRYGKILQKNRDLFTSEMKKLKKLSKEISLEEKKKLIKQIILNPSSAFEKKPKYKIIQKKDVVNKVQAKNNKLNSKINIDNKGKVTVEKGYVEVKLDDGTVALQKLDGNRRRQSGTLSESELANLLRRTTDQPKVNYPEYTAEQIKKINNVIKGSNNPNALIPSSPTYKPVLNLGKVNIPKLNNFLNNIIRFGLGAATSALKANKLNSYPFSGVKIIPSSSIKALDEIKEKIKSKQAQTSKQSQAVKTVTKPKPDVPKKVTVNEALKILEDLSPLKIIDPIKIPDLEKKLLKKKIKLPNLNLKFDWDSKPRGYERIVNPIVRIKGKNKELQWKTTPNRALKRITRLIDNTTSRSFQLKIIGIKKVKDINKFNLSKFRAKKSKGSPVLKVVEKSKHAIDTLGEKQGLTLSKALKKKNVTKRVTKSKQKAKKKATEKKTKKTATKRKIRKNGIQRKSKTKSKRKSKKR